MHRTVLWLLAVTPVLLAPVVAAEPRSTADLEEIALISGIISVTVYDVQDDQVLGVVPIPHPTLDRSMVLSTDLSEAWVTSTRGIHRIDLETTPPTLDPNMLPVSSTTSIRLAQASERYLLIGANRQLHGFDLETRTLVDSIETPGGVVIWSLECDDEGRIAIGTRAVFDVYGEVHLSSLSTDGLFGPWSTVPHMFLYLRSVRFTPDGEHVVTCDANLDAYGGGLAFIHADRARIEDTQSLPASISGGPSMVFEQTSGRLFVRHENQVLAFDPNAAGWGAPGLDLSTPEGFYHFDVPSTGSIAVSPSTRQLFVQHWMGSPDMLIHDSETGELLSSRPDLGGFGIVLRAKKASNKIIAAR